MVMGALAVPVLSPRATILCRQGGSVMNSNRTFAFCLPVLFFAFLLLTAGDSFAAEPLTEANLVKLIELELGDEAVIGKIRKDGLGFKVSEETLGRLKKAGASDELLAAVKETSKTKKPAPGKAITYQDVLGLVELRIDEAAILKRLDQSPTLFVLDAEQETQLKDAGASARLIDALKGKRRPPEQVHDITDFAVILDCSGSMKEHTKDGEAKMEVAKKVLTQLVGRIPDGLNLTFVIYGHDRELECEAVEIARPLSELDSAGKSKLGGMIAKLQPAGATPIALALRTAGKELAKNDAYCGLVLISDGKETCKGDPAAEVAALADNLKLTFGAHVIGFDVDGEGRAQLEKVAAAGGGKYYNARDADELASAIDSIEREIEKVAPEPPVIQIQKGVVSAILVSPLTLEGFPQLEEVFVIKAGDKLNDNFLKIIQRTKELGKAMVVSPGKYDVICQPAGAMRIALMKNVEVKARETVKINTNRVASALVMADPKIEGLSAIKRLCAVPAGVAPNGVDFNFGGLRQQCPGFGKPLLLTAGEAFDIVFEPKEGARVTIVENVVLKGGELTIIGGDEE